MEFCRGSRMHLVQAPQTPQDHARLAEGEEEYFHRVPYSPHCRYCNGEPNEWDWSFVDAILCVCLVDRVDRLEGSSQQFHKYGLCQSVVYFRPRRPSEATKAQWTRSGVRDIGFCASWISHVRATRAAHEDLGAERALFFEDDVEFLPRMTPDALHAVARNVRRLPDDWDIFYLGHWPAAGYPHLGIDPMASCWRVWSKFIHAYIQSAKQMKYLVRLPYPATGLGENEKPLDIVLRRSRVQYAHFPTLTVQAKVGSSDNNLTTTSQDYHHDNVDYIERRNLFAMPAIGMLLCLLFLFLLLKWLTQPKKRNTSVG